MEQEQAQTKEIKKGDLTNKGLVKMVDRAWRHENGDPADVLVVTDQGPFRMSELVRIEKAEHPEPRPPKEQVSFNAVLSLDIRPGFVSSAERIPNTDKLIHMKVKTSLGTKSVVTNLGGQYDPADLAGRTFMFVLNVPSVQMKDVLSEAMILAADGYKYDSHKNEWVGKASLVDLTTTVDYIIL